MVVIVLWVCIWLALYPVLLCTNFYRKKKKCKKIGMTQLHSTSHFRKHQQEGCEGTIVTQCLNVAGPFSSYSQFWCQWIRHKIFIQKLNIGIIKDHTNCSQRHECNFSYIACYFMPKIYSYVTDQHRSTMNSLGSHTHPIRCLSTTSVITVSVGIAVRLLV